MAFDGNEGRCVLQFDMGGTHDMADGTYVLGCLISGVAPDSDVQLLVPCNE